MLADVRAAGVPDWPRCRRRCDADAERSPRRRRGAAALVPRRAMTLLGHETWTPAEQRRRTLGIFRDPGRCRSGLRRAQPGAGDAFRRTGGEAPLLLKSNPHLDRPPPRAARPGRRAGRRPTGKVDRRCRSMPGCGPAPRCAPRRTTCRCCARGWPRSRRSSASIRRAMPARRCAMRCRRAAARPADRVRPAATGGSRADRDVAGRPAAAEAGAGAERARRPSVRLRLAAARRPDHRAPHRRSRS